jgi:hypothetical protein
VEDVDRMDEMLEAIQAEVTEDPPIAEVEAFFKLLKASEDQLHEYTKAVGPRRGRGLKSAETTIVRGNL